ncbi:FAD-dependent oxidoreductase, partial [Pseudomonas sp. MWU12-2534b]
DYRKGGVLYCAAGYPELETSLSQYLDKIYAQGLGPADYHWLNPQQLAQLIRVAKSYGGIYAKHCETIQPARLVRGLARAVERLGVGIYENSPVSHRSSGSHNPGRAAGRSCGTVPAVEGYSASVPPPVRDHLPVKSLLRDTQPSPAAFSHHIV